MTLASFLLGGPSGSGVATTLLYAQLLGRFFPAGYDKESAGGLLAAGGIGAIISPPVLGAAAFLIAEFLKMSYIEVIARAHGSDNSLLLVDFRHGRARCAEVRRQTDSG